MDLKERGSEPSVKYGNDELQQVQFYLPEIYGSSIKRINVASFKICWVTTKKHPK